jgi:hypothetical protein
LRKIKSNNFNINMKSQTPKAKRTNAIEQTEARF